MDKDERKILGFRPQIGDVVFTRRKKGLFPRLIRIFSGGFGYSHVAVVGDITDGFRQVYTTGAQRHGFNWLFGKVRLIDYLRNKDYAVLRYRSPARGMGLSQQQKDEILDWNQKHIGTKYPQKKALKYLELLLEGEGFNKVAVHGIKGCVLCYEAVGRAFLAAGIELNPRGRKLDPSAYNAPEIYYSPVFKQVFESKKHHEDPFFVTK